MDRKRQYDKFGFFSIEPNKTDSFDKYSNESRSNRRRSPYGREGRDRKYSPDRREFRDERRGEFRNEKNESNWRKREYSPSRNVHERNSSRNQKDQMDFDSNWESSFNQNQDFINPPPAPSFSNEPPVPFAMNDNNYNSQFGNAPSYNFLDVPMPPPPNIMEPPAPIPPPPPTIQPNTWTHVPPAPSQEDKSKKEAIAMEVLNQRATLAKQKEDYLKKVSVLKRELDSLKNQRIELRGDPKRSPSPDSQRFLKENAKLQSEIISKIKSFDNIIDMLNGIIGDAIPTNNGEKTKKNKSSKKSSSRSGSSGDSSSSEEEKKSSHKKRKSRSRSKVSDKKFNYVFYDPEMHWCRICNEFPSTAKNYLNHLHSATHQKNAMTQIEAPWHSNSNLNEGMPNYPGATSKRTPIKGLQFFVPSSAWYCKLCDQWIGDLHCASAHLKSVTHTQNYANFVDLNPHWEMDWMSDRQKNYEKIHKSSEVEKKVEFVADSVIQFQPDGTHTKKESSPLSSQPEKISSKAEKKEKKKKEKKKSKKRRYSSSGSSSAASDSDDNKKKKSKADSNQEEKPSQDERAAKDDQKENDDKSVTGDDSLLSQWMSLKQETLTDQDKKILEKLRNTVKTKSVEKPEQKIDSRVVSREREARELLNIQGDRARKIVQKMESRTKEESSSYSKYFEPKGHLSKREREEQNEDKFDSHSSDKHKKGHKDTSSSDSKKMPFIGKMPLYKSLSTKPSKSEPEPPKPTLEECVEAAKKKRDEINAQLQKSVEEMKEKLQKSLAQKEALVGLPAPGLVIPTALASVPEVVKPPAPYTQPVQRIKKSPVKNTTAKKSTSPTRNNKESKNDPLHKDFQDALDIIFPSAADPSNPTENQVDMTDQSQQAYSQNMDMYSQDGWMQAQNYMGHMAPNNMGGMAPMGPMGMMGPMGPMGPMPQMGPMGPNMPPMGHMAPMPMGPPMGYPDQGYPPMSYMANSIPDANHVTPKETVDDDLAMLGIDAEDVGAGGF